MKGRGFPRGDAQCLARHTAAQIVGENCKAGVLEACV